MYPGPNSPTTRTGADESSSDVCTPPLVFSPNFVGVPAHSVDNGGTPPMQPLQVFTNFNAHGSGSGTGVLRRSSSQVYEADNSPIRVKARTRDGRHSPYMAGNPDAGQMDLDNQGPYGFSYSGRSSPLAVSTPTNRAPIPSFAQVGAGGGDEFYTGHAAAAAEDMARGMPYPNGPHQPLPYGAQNSPYYGGTAQYTAGGQSQPQRHPQSMPMQQQQQHAAPHQQQLQHQQHQQHQQQQYQQQQYQQQQQPHHGQQMQHIIVSDKAYSHSSLDPAFELPAPVVHRALKGRCRYIAFPANLAAPAVHGAGGSPTPHDDNGVALFIGQVRFETTPAELTWLVQRTCGAVASRLEGRGAGCYLLYCRGETDLQLIRGLHKRVLFDVGGAWLARTPEEVDALCEYVAIDAPLLSKKARLPRDSMVVEDLKVDAAPSAPRGGGDGGASAGHGGPSSKKSGHGHGSSHAHGRHSGNSNHHGNTTAANDRPRHPRVPPQAGGQQWPHASGSASAPAPPPEYGSSAPAGAAPPPYGAQ